MDFKFEFAKAHSNQPVIVDGKCNIGIGSSSNCPIGTRNQEREHMNSMAECMAKMFEVSPTPSLSSDGMFQGWSP